MRSLLLTVSLLALLALVSSLPVSLQRDLSSARATAAATESDEALVALQVGEAAKLTAEAAKAEGGEVPTILPLRARTKTEREEEDFFALIDEHQDNLELGQSQARGGIRHRLLASAPFAHGHFLCSLLLSL